MVKATLSTMVCIVLLLLAWVHPLKANEVLIHGVRYGGGPGNMSEMALFADEYGVYKTGWPYSSDGTWRSFPTVDIMVYDSHAKLATVVDNDLLPVERHFAFAAEGVSEWLDGITAIAANVTRGDATLEPYLQGVQWSISTFKNPWGSAVRLYLVMGPGLEDLSPFRPISGIGEWGWEDKSDFSSWLWSGCVLWCSGSHDCGSVTIDRSDWGSAWSLRGLGDTGCSRGLDLEWSLDPKCGCNNLASDESESELYSHVPCYACVDEGVSSVWNVPDSVCVQGDIELTPNVTLRGVSGTAVVSVGFSGSVRVEGGTSTTLGAVSFRSTDASHPFDGTVFGSGTPYVVSVGHELCLNASGCDVVTWEPEWVFDSAPPASLNVTVTFTGHGGSDVVTFPQTTSPRFVPSLDGWVTADGVRMQRLGFEEYEMFPALTTLASGTLVLCKTAGRPSCGGLRWSSPTGTLASTVGDNVTSWNLPLGTTGCEGPVSGSYASYQWPSCSCGWQTTSGVSPCGNCSEGLVRSPSPPHDCVSCVTAAGCDVDHTASSSCVGDYGSYVCSCGDGWDPSTGCSTCLAGYYASESTGGECVPCGEALGCHPAGTASAFCGSTPFGYVATCSCNPGWVGERCDGCYESIGLVASSSSPDTAECVLASEWCGAWGVHVGGAVANCSCHHGRSGERCTECDGEALCGLGGRCTSNPSSKYVCDCSGSNMTHPWWGGFDAFARCEACPVGQLPLNWTAGAIGGCDDAESVCDGVSDAVASSIAGRCVCRPGWTFGSDGTSCDTCVPGRVGFYCQPCDEVCGGVWWDTCSVPVGDAGVVVANASDWCTCGPGRAGPPCDGSCLGGWREIDGECVECPPGCPDAHCSVTPASPGVSSTVVCECPLGTAPPDCLTCAPGWVEALPGGDDDAGPACVPCPVTGCLNGVCVAGGVCECKPGFVPPSCSTCYPTHVADGGSCVECVSAGSRCGPNGRCTVRQDGEEACLCDAGYTWVPTDRNGNATCVRCGDDTTGPSGGCLPCPTCPPGSSCTFRVNASAVYEATCGCDNSGWRIGLLATRPNASYVVTRGELMSHPCYAANWEYDTGSLSGVVVNGSNLSVPWYHRPVPVVVAPYVAPSNRPRSVLWSFLITSIAVVIGLGMIVLVLLFILVFHDIDMLVESNHHLPV